MREFLARTKLAHDFRDVRKAPIDAAGTLALVRRHAHAIAKRGAKLVEFDPRTASDELVLKHFLGREGTLRAPTIAVGDTIMGGFDRATFERLLAR